MERTGKREGRAGRPAPIVLTIGQVAGLLGLSEAHVRQAVAAGYLPSVRYGRAIRIPAEALRKGWAGHRRRRERRERREERSR